MSDEKLQTFSTGFEGRGGKAEHELGIFLSSSAIGGARAEELAQATMESVTLFLRSSQGDEDVTFPFVIRSHLGLAANLLCNALGFANQRMMVSNRKLPSVHSRVAVSMSALYFDEGVASVVQIGAGVILLERSDCETTILHPQTYGSFCDPLNPRRREFGRVGEVPLQALGVRDEIEPEVFEFRAQPGDKLIFLSPGNQDARVTSDTVLNGPSSPERRWIEFRAAI